jgi:hypothetical protein
MSACFKIVALNNPFENLLGCSPFFCLRGGSYSLSLTISPQHRSCACHQRYNLAIYGWQLPALRDAPLCKISSNILNDDRAAFSLASRDGAKSK